MEGPDHLNNLKISSSTKRKNTAKEIIIYTQSLLFITEAWKYQSIFLFSLYTPGRLGTPTSFLIYVQFKSHWEATQIWWLWGRHEHQTKLCEFIYEEILAYGFNNFVCMISVRPIVLKFVQIPWPDARMKNLEECLYRVLTNFILLNKNTRLLKKCE